MDVCSFIFIVSNPFGPVLQEVKIFCLDWVKKQRVSKG